MKNLDFVLFYQYFDYQESILKDDIYRLQRRVIYKNPSDISDDELIELITKKIRLQTIREVEQDLLKFMRDSQ